MLVIIASSALGCVASPDVRAGDEALARGELEEAKRAYSGALYHGLRDRDEARRVEEKLDYIAERENFALAARSLEQGDELLAARDFLGARAAFTRALDLGMEARGDEDAARAGLERASAGLFAALGEEARAYIASASDYGCAASLNDAAVMLREPLPRAQRAALQRQFERCSDALMREDPRNTALVLSALQAIEEADSEWVAGRYQAIEADILAALGRRERALERSLGWLDFLATSRWWRGLGAASQIASKQDKLATWVIDQMIAATTPSRPACLEILSHPQLHIAKQSRARVEARCSSEIEVALATAEAATVSIDATDTLVALEALAARAPMDEAQVVRLKALQGRYAQVWRARAERAKVREARAFYLSMADALDGGSSAKELRGQIARDLRARFRVPAIEVSRVDVGELCDVSPEAISAQLFTSTSNGGLAAKHELSLSCSVKIEAEVRVIGVYEQLVSEECSTLTVPKARPQPEFKCLEYSDGTRTWSDCRYGYWAKGKADTSKPKTIEFCDREVARMAQYAVSWCMKQDVSGRGQFTGPDGEVIDEVTPSRFRYDKCDKYSDHILVEDLPTNESLTQVLTARAAANARAYAAKLTPQMSSVARAYKQRRAAEIAAEAKQLVARDLASSDPEVRIRGAFIEAYSQQKLLSKSKRLRALAPAPGFLVVLAGQKRRAPEVRRFDELWGAPTARALPRFTPDTSRLDRFVSLRDKVIAAPKPTPRILRASPSPLDSTRWLSTGKYLHPHQGPALVFSDRIGDSDWIGLADVTLGRELVADATFAQLSWNFGASLRRWNITGGVKANRFSGLTTGGQLEVVRVGGRVGVEPSLVWTIGATADWTALGGQRAMSLRVPFTLSVPVLEQASLDFGLEPDVLHLSGVESISSNTTTQTAHSRAWIGATWTLMRGRLALHAELGPSVSAFATDPLTGRVQTRFRF